MIGAFIIAGFCVFNKPIRFCRFLRGLGFPTFSYLRIPSFSFPTFCWSLLLFSYSFLHSFSSNQVTHISGWLPLGSLLSLCFLVFLWFWFPESTIPLRLTFRIYPRLRTCFLSMWLVVILCGHMGSYCSSKSWWGNKSSFVWWECGHFDISFFRSELPVAFWRLFGRCSHFPNAKWGWVYTYAVSYWSATQYARLGLSLEIDPLGWPWSPLHASLVV